MAPPPDVGPTPRLLPAITARRPAVRGGGDVMSTGSEHGHLVAVDRSGDRRDKGLASNTH